jgi:hypothetical protein
MKPLSMNQETEIFFNACIYKFHIFIQSGRISLKMLADRGDENLFWTDMTRQGCAGQYSACFSNATIVNRIHSTPFDGNCVAYYNNKKLGAQVFKTMQCKTRLSMVCIGYARVETSQPTLAVSIFYQIFLFSY